MTYLDLFMWDGGSSCFRKDMQNYPHMGDDYITVLYTDPSWSIWVEYCCGC